MIGEFLTLCNIVQNGIGNKASLILLGKRAVDLNLISFWILGPEGLALSLGVVLDNRICRIQDGLGTAIVLLQTDYLGIAVLVFKVLDIFDSCSTEFIDTLVIITNNADIVVSASKQTYQQELRVVGILILVHHDVAEAIAIFL